MPYPAPKHYYRHPSQHNQHNYNHNNNNSHQQQLPFTYVLLAALSFMSCLLLSWYTFERSGYISNDENTPPKTPEEVMAQIFQDRRRQVEMICRRRYPRQQIAHPQLLMARSGKPFSQRLPYNLYVSEPLKLIFCSIPKVASSNWYAYFDKLSRNSTFTGVNVTLNESQPILKSIHSFSAGDAKRVLDTFKKIVWVREPLERLVSAWRDKLTVYNPYYSKVVGQEIIKKFRFNATKKEISDGYPSTLEEFFKYLKSYPRTRYDVHWRPYYFACAPCNQPTMSFDYIGHLENLEDEADYIMRKVTQRTDYPPFPAPSQNRTSDSILRQVVSQVDSDLVDIVLRNFQIDYELFGYHRPNL